MLIKERAYSLNTQADCERVLTELDEVVAANNAAGETTAVAAIVSSAGIVGASVGDSGAWLVNGTVIDDLTMNQVCKPFIGTGAAIPIGFARCSDSAVRFRHRTIGLSQPCSLSVRRIARRRYLCALSPRQTAMIECENQTERLNEPPEPSPGLSAAMPWDTSNKTSCALTGRRSR